MLLPGGKAELGYDTSEPFEPSGVQLESFGSSYEMFEYETSMEEVLEVFREHLELTTTPLRTVTIAPMLVEVVHREYLDQEELDEVVAVGFRPPTSDEWEYACAAGSRTLFRWGHDCPTDAHPEEYVKRKDWDHHTCPNAFGLIIADDPWQPERCVEPNMVRGGDGGGYSCGGAPSVCGWLTLASSFLQDFSGSLSKFRRVFPLVQANPKSEPLASGD